MIKKTQIEHHKDLITLINNNPKYQKGGNYRFVVEQMGEEMGIDPDHTHGIDDGEEPWNLNHE